jgi:hypothetical protein
LRSLSLSHTHTIGESSMSIRLWLVWLSHTHRHTHICMLRYTLDASETTCIKCLFTPNINLDIYDTSSIQMKAEGYNMTNKITNDFYFIELWSMLKKLLDHIVRKYINGQRTCTRRYLLVHHYFLLSCCCLQCML